MVFSEFLSCNDEDRRHAGTQISIRGGYFWLPQGWNVRYDRLLLAFCSITHARTDGLASFVSRIVMVLELVGALIGSGPVRLFVGRPGIPPGDSGESEGGCEEY